MRERRRVWTRDHQKDNFFFVVAVMTCALILVISFLG